MRAFDVGDCVAVRVGDRVAVRGTVSRRTWENGCYVRLETGQEIPVRHENLEYSAELALPEEIGTESIDKPLLMLVKARRDELCGSGWLSMGFGPFTTQDEVDDCIAAIKEGRQGYHLPSPYDENVIIEVSTYYPAKEPTRVQTN